MAEAVRIPVRVIREMPGEAPSPLPDEPTPAGDIESAPAPHQAEIEQLEKERDRCLCLARRTQVEFDEYRRRARQELATVQEDTLAQFLQAFLPAFDDLDRVVAEGSKEGCAAGALTGVRLARDNLWRTLTEAGVSPVQAEIGQAFDPLIHEAIATRCSAGQDPGTIVEVFQNGFRLCNKILRPAKVVVAVAPGGGVAVEEGI